LVYCVWKIDYSLRNQNNIIIHIFSTAWFLVADRGIKIANQFVIQLLKCNNTNSWLWTSTNLILLCLSTILDDDILLRCLIITLYIYYSIRSVSWLETTVCSLIDSLEIQPFISTRLPNLTGYYQIWETRARSIDH